MSSKQKAERKELFGKASDGFQSLREYNWRDGEDQLLEIPVTTFPFCKVPIHASYLLYLGQFSTHLARLYFAMAMKTCRLANVSPSFLLHPLDFLGREDQTGLDFFPGMDQSAERKIRLLEQLLSSITKRFDVVPMREHAHRIRSRVTHERSITQATIGASESLAKMADGFPAIEFMK